MTAVFETGLRVLCPTMLASDYNKQKSKAPPAMKRLAAAMKKPASAVVETRFGFARQRADSNNGRIHVRSVGQKRQLPGETESSTDRRGQP